METGRLADLHAFVDDCLEPDERLAFEQQMAQDPALARRASLWRAQNNAIRTAFDGEGARAFPISVIRHQNESLVKAGRSAAVGKPSLEQPTQPASLRIADTSRLSAKVAAPDSFRPSLLWQLGLAVVSVCFALVWTPAATVVPARGLGEAGVAAFQAFARPGVESVEFATTDTAESQAWLTTRLMHPVYLPVTPSAFRLIGARIAPYPGAPAALVVYKSQDGPVGLLVQPLDAPAARKPQLLTAANGRTAAVWTWRGQGLALVGDLDGAALLKIAAEFADSPAEAAQPMPERGW
jgi:anti-sigma factor RsiW